MAKATTKTKTKTPKTKPKTKPKTQPKPAAPPPQTKVDAKTITKAQIAELKRLSIEAGDDPMLQQIRILYDKKSSAAARKRALAFCVDLHNDLIAIANY